jgi:hypothetical protein
MIWTVVDAAKIHFLALAKIWLTKGRHCDRGRAYRGHFGVPEGGHNSTPVTRAAETALLAGAAPVLLRVSSRQTQYVVKDLEETYQLQ